ncbi:helix-turn-helix transcriptional regulator [Amycolatopsis bartoniae]|uniref:HTH luxR-type domain-containing protein n=1 Tax=Amycolatopsis bartoniae TaxID=941986 RepID=A0A8H9IZZ7_9PSEU|nr:helix-turn-helix transcriptional regulator [Amycolatopsis bartoniae]TVT11370.1 helix-turn-helix transcriptional regulator [Amycolatopsis bartoniae]GHF66521.1 hypothetical protein GCM10017566_45400 [Amycolatopsis bartoniae]
MGGLRTEWIINTQLRVPCLSERQREVFLALGEGLSTREIASRLAISEHTVKLHITNILQILGLTSRLQVGLVAFAYEAGCLSGCDSCRLGPRSAS